MILQKEIREKSQKLGVPPEIIDKDWVLSHVLKGIYSLEEWRDKLVFKGGTCLKKCYFPNYRFSEDLDFTALTDDNLFSDEVLGELCEIVFVDSGIRLSVSKKKNGIIE